MADIELVIKIPKEIYSDIMEQMREDGMSADYFERLIQNGVPLPEEHGDLIDRDDLLADSYCIDAYSGEEVNIVDVMTVKMADTIIEAHHPEPTKEKSKSSEDDWER